MKFCKHCQYDNLVGKIIELDDKEIIFFEGDELKYIFQVYQGYVKMVRYLENGDERIIGILGPGDYLGLLALLQERKEFLATAIPLTKVSLKKIPKFEVVNAYESNLKFRDSCLKCAVTRSNLFQNSLVNSANSDTLDKIINTLNSLFERFGLIEKANKVLILPFSKTVLANIIGIRRETLSRYLSKLQQEKVIRIEKNKYYLLYVI